MTFALLAVAFTSCSKDFTDDLVKDNKPEIPVTFEGATTYGFNPYYTIPLSGDSVIRFNINIPGDAPLKIREVSKMIAGGTGITPGNLKDAAVVSYLSGPVAVNGTSVTITTNIREFNTKVSAANRITTAPAAGAFIERAFLFLLTMDDGSEIIPVQCRIRIIN